MSDPTTSGPIIIYIYAFSKPVPDWSGGEIYAAHNVRIEISVTASNNECAYAVKDGFEFVIKPALDITYLLDNEI